jgi:hypothetical protein
MPSPKGRVGYLMRGTRKYTIAIALALAVAGGIAAPLPAFGTATSNPGVTFEYYPTIDSTQLCLAINRHGDARLWTCSYKKDQAWIRGREIKKRGYYQFKNKDGQCLGVAGSSKKKGAQVVGTKCKTGVKSQYWAVDFWDRHTYACFLFNYNSNYVLEPVDERIGKLVKQEPWVGDHAPKKFRQSWVQSINS